MSAALTGRVGKLGGLAAIVAFAIALPFFLSTSKLSTATFVVILAIGVTGLNILSGYAGQISLGHAFFLAVGAYTGAYLGGNHGVSALVWIPAAAVTAGLFGLLVGPMALRLKGLYLAIVTLGLIFIGQHMWFNIDTLTGGPQGRTFPVVVMGPFDFSSGQVLRIGGATIDSNGLYYFLGLILLGLATLFAWNLRRTRTGRAMVAVREREAAAAVMGVDVGRTKVIAFVVSSAMAGVSGALYGSYLSFAQPAQWDLLLSIQFIAAIIIGGMGTLAGPILGSIVVFAMKPVLQSLPFVPEEGTGGVTVGDLTSIAYGLLTILFLVFEPRGLVGLADRLRSVRRRPPASTPSNTSHVPTPEEAHP